MAKVGKIKLFKEIHSPMMIKDSWEHSHYSEVDGLVEGELIVVEFELLSKLGQKILNDEDQ